MTGEDRIRDGLRSLARAAFSDGRGPERAGAIHEMSVDELKGHLKTGDWSKPMATFRPAPAPSALQPARKAGAATPADIHALATTLKVPSDNAPAFMAATRAITGKDHLDDMTPGQLAMVAARLRKDPTKFVAAPTIRKTSRPMPAPNTETSVLENIRRLGGIRTVDANGRRTKEGQIGSPMPSVMTPPFCRT